MGVDEQLDNFCAEIRQQYDFIYFQKYFIQMGRDIVQTNLDFIYRIHKKYGRKYDIFVKNRTNLFQEFPQRRTFHFFFL